MEDSFSLPIAKRRKICDDDAAAVSLRINSAHFQTLMFQKTPENYDNAIIFAHKCGMYINNSKLYSAKKENEHMTMFSVWVRIQQCEEFSGEKIVELFYILLATDADKNTRLTNMYDEIEKDEWPISTMTLDCLLDYPNIFPPSHALKFFAGQSIRAPNYKYFTKSLELSLECECPYTAVNRILEEGGKSSYLNPLEAVVHQGCSQRLLDLLYLIPILDLDNFFFPHDCKLTHCAKHRWYSVEEWIENAEMKENVINGMIREARSILEEYRTKCSSLVHSMLVTFPNAICNIINAYGKRPPKLQVLQ